MTLSELERRLGHKFTRATLLEQALTHRSFSAGHNERLEFLGDSILNCSIATLIFEHFPLMPEGELSRLRANLVNQSVLAEISDPFPSSVFRSSPSPSCRTHLMRPASVVSPGCYVAPRYDYLAFYL